MTIGGVVLEGLGIAILTLFIVSIIIITIERRKYQEYGINTDNDRTAKKSFGFGYVLSLLLAVLVTIALSGSRDSRATYYINGVVARGGTNWMIVVITFIIGGGIIGLLIQLLSALPFVIARSVSKESRQARKNTFSVGRKMANTSLWCGIIAYPVFIISSINKLVIVAPLIALLASSICAVCSIGSIISCKRENELFYKRNIAGFFFTAVYLFGGIGVMLSGF